MNNPRASKSFFQSTVWQVLRWLPLASMLALFVLIVGLLLRGGLEKITGWYLLPLITPVMGLVWSITIAIYFYRRRRKSRLLTVTLAVALLCLSPSVLWVVPVTYPASLSEMTPAATVRLPANVALRVLWGGDSVDVNYHAAVPDQRWAYDLVVAPYLTYSQSLTDYGCYGVPVVAPASGEVVIAHDGEPDQTPGFLSNNFDAPLGNHIAIRLETDTFIIITHLKEGSVAVKVGQQIEEGEQIGQCGNSGNTSEPHIHIHHQRQDPNIFPVNFVEGLPLYFRDHNGDPMPLGGIRVVDGIPEASGATVQHLGK